MTTIAAPHERDPAWRGRVAATLLAAVVLVPLLRLAEFEPWTLFDTASLRATAHFVTNLFPPAHDPAFFAAALAATWQTIAIATAGMTIAMVLAIPATIVMTRVASTSAIGKPMSGGPASVRTSTRWAMVGLRSVPELVFALFFVRLFGLGPTAAVLAIGLSYAGMLAKVFAEIIESGDSTATHALLVNGSSRIGALLFGALPQCLPELSSYAVYRWECAIRGSVMMGFVGAGGLGQQIDTSMKMFAGGEVATLLAIFVVLVLAADRVSRMARGRAA
jgi:phosphonate transport system permease protein